MSNVMFIERLLDGAEVEWIPLRKIGTWYGGGTPSKTRNDFWENGTIPWVSPKDMGRPIVDSSEDYITEVAIDGSSTRLVPANSVAIVVRSSILDKKLPTAFIPVPVTLNQDMKAVIPHENINARYVAHLLTSRGDDILRAARKTGGSVASIDSGKLYSFLVPIPCPSNPARSLEIQSEIVRILDTFTKLTAKLTAELTARKKQYNYYRDQLLRFEDGEVEWRTLGEIGEFTYGHVAKSQESGDVRFVRITDIDSNGKLISSDVKYVDLSEDNKKFLLKRGDLLMARTGATFGKTMIFDENYPAIFAGFLIKLALNPRIISPYFYWHFAQSSYFWDQAKKLVSGGGQPQFNANVLKDVKVPIPHPRNPDKSLAYQARIVTLLDRFDALSGSLKEGLPREIELRQKQYEYYRDLLLSFPRPEEATV